MVKALSNQQRQAFRKVITGYVKIRQTVRSCRAAAATAEQTASALRTVVDRADMPLLRQLARRVPKRPQWANVRKMHDKMFCLLSGETMVDLQGGGQMVFLRVAPADPSATAAQDRYFRHTPNI